MNKFDESYTYNNLEIELEVQGVSDYYLKNMGYKLFFGTQESVNNSLLFKCKSHIWWWE